MEILKIVFVPILFILAIFVVRFTVEKIATIRYERDYRKLREECEKKKGEINERDTIQG